MISMKKQQTFVLSLLFILVQYSVAAQDLGPDSQILKNIPYYEINTDDAYIRDRCLLDIFIPAAKNEFPTVVWFHGGGLTGGEKFLPERLINKGIAVVSVNYRLNPKVSSPAYIEDAAAATAWVFRNIEKYGGDTKKIIIAGHSAGGYLAMMIGLDRKWLARHNIESDDIYLLVPFSGHTITHMTVRKERGIPDTQPIVDEMAPLFHVRQDAPPLHLITGDRDLEMLGRYEENAYMWRMMNVVGHKQTHLYELHGFNHGEMAEPAFDLLLKIIHNQ